MGEIELNIKKEDWVYISFFGMIFSLFLGILIYFCSQKNIFHGAIFGLLGGFLIAIFSFILITIMNKFILFGVGKKLGYLLSIIFSFLSGFFAFLVLIKIFLLFNLNILEPIVQKPLQASIIIGVLTYAIGALMYKIVKIRNEKEYAEKLFLQNKLSSLQTQLNPHFLFNALNSIAYLIEENPKKAESAVLKVSSFLRNTMSEKPILLLENEIFNLTEYIEVENIRYDNKIKLIINKNIPNWKVPKFSIQLLAENAIKHGFVFSNKEIIIQIEFDEHNRKIIIQNSGKKIENFHFGIGLSNLEQRLQFLCNSKIALISWEPVVFEIYIGECNEDIVR